MDENKDVKQEAEIVLPEEPSHLKQTTEEVAEVTEEAAAQTEPVVTETAESGKGANQRIRELNQRAKDAEAKAQSLSERLAEITQPIGFPAKQETGQYPYTDGQEITPEQYQTDVTKTARAEVQIQIAQNNAVNRIQNESLDAVRRYPQLDPMSEQFDKELSETVTEAVEAQVRVNPYTASVSKFVDKLMKPYQGAVAKEVGKATENIAKQVSESALRPTSVRQAEKAAKDKTMAELEAELGVVNS